MNLAEKLYWTVVVGILVGVSWDTPLKKQLERLWMGVTYVRAKLVRLTPTYHRMERESLEERLKFAHTREGALVDQIRSLTGREERLDTLLTQRNKMYGKLQSEYHSLYLEVGELRDEVSGVRSELCKKEDTAQKLSVYIEARERTIDAIRKFRDELLGTIKQQNMAFEVSKKVRTNLETELRDRDHQISLLKLEVGKLWRKSRRVDKRKKV